MYDFIVVVASIFSVPVVVSLCSLARERILCLRENTIIAHVLMSHTCNEWQHGLHYLVPTHIAPRRKSAQIHFVFS